MTSTEEEPSQDTPKPADKEDQRDKLNHEDLIKYTKNAISRIVETDPLLSDIPQDPTSEEIKAATAVAQGQAIRLFLDRGPLPRLAIVVSYH